MSRRGPPVPEGLPRGTIAGTMDKTVASADEAVADFFDGATMMAGGFGLCGIPENLIAALRAQRDEGADHHLEQLRHRRQGARHPAGQWPGQEDGLQLRRREQDFEQRYLDGQLEVELTPQGTLAERIRAGGAGIPAFYTATGYGTVVAEGKETRAFGGRPYVMETGADRRLRAGQGLEGRSLRQPRVSKDGAQLQPDDGGRRQGHDRRGRAAGRGRADRARPGPHAGDLRAADHQRREVRKAHRAADGSQIRCGRWLSRRRRQEGAPDAAAHARSGGPARRPRAARRDVRQPRDRDADAGRELRAGRHRHRPAVRERHARHRAFPLRRSRRTPISSTPASRRSRRCPAPPTSRRPSRSP